jgi:hypothetical protein
MLTVVRRGGSSRRRSRHRRWDGSQHDRDEQCGEPDQQAE